MLRGSHPTNRRVAGGGTPPTPNPARFPYRGIYAIDGDFDQLVPAAGTRPLDQTMKMNLMEVQVFAGFPANAGNRLDLLQARTPTTPRVDGWLYMGGHAESSAGGSFGTMTNAVVQVIVLDIKDHPNFSNYYYLFDEANLNVGTWTVSQINANRTLIRDRRNFIKSLDPNAICVGAEFKQSQLDPTFNANWPHGIWGGTDTVGATTYTDRVVDEVWLSGYPFPTALQTTTQIPNQAGWCNAAGVPYSGIMSVHNNLNVSPRYPTVSEMNFGFDQWAATAAKNILVYIWEDEWDPAESSSPDYQLRDNPAGFATQTDVGAKMATYD